MTFGVLRYDNSLNLGDNIQSLAASQFFPACVTVDRDSGSVGQTSQVKLIFNCWSDGHFTSFPPPANIDPLLVSLHINDQDHSCDPSFTYLQPRDTFVPIASHVEYLKAHEPVGCRDLHTMRMLQQRGIKAYFSGCLTLTLRNRFTSRNNHILCVDVPEHVIHNLFGNGSSVRRLKQALDCPLPHVEKMRLAQERLDELAQAQLVVTSRLHVALPCLAFGTKVIFAPKDVNDVRFDGWLPYLTLYVPGMNLATARPAQDFPHGLVNDLRKRVSLFVGPQPLPFPVREKDRVSLIAACRNRHAHLLKTLPTWLRAVDIDEIVLVDWGSDPPIESIVVANQSKKIKLVTVSNVTQWNLTRAYNVALRMVSNDFVLKVDCDTMLNHQFCAYHCLRPRRFFAGNWARSRNANEQHTNGVFFAPLRALNEVGLFNELISTYGWDDDCLYQRLTKKCNMERLLLNLDMVSHLEHPNSTRSNQERPLDVEIECNRLIGELDAWRDPFPFSQFKLFQHDPERFVAEPIFSVELAPFLREKLLQQALLNREQRPKKFYLNALNGLCNRLRALASALVISRATKRQCFVIWKEDLHCGARFEDLFLPCKDLTVLSDDAVIDMDTVDFYNYAAEKDVLIDDASPRTIYVQSACVLKNKHTSWTKENEVLRELRPVASIQSQVKQLAARAEAAVGVHVRSGQNVEICPWEDTSQYKEESKNCIEKWRGVCTWQVFLEEMQRCQLKRNIETFFVCCDKPETFAHLQAEMHDKVFCAPKQCWDRSKEQVQSALVDILLLSITQFILGSPWSSFSEIAHRLSISKPMYLAGIDFGKK